MTFDLEGKPGKNCGSYYQDDFEVGGGSRKRGVVTSETARLDSDHQRLARVVEQERTREAQEIEMRIIRIRGVIKEKLRALFGDQGMDFIHGPLCATVEQRHIQKVPSNNVPREAVLISLERVLAGLSILNEERPDFVGQLRVEFTPWYLRDGAGVKAPDGYINPKVIAPELVGRVISALDKVA